MYHLTGVTKDYRKGRDGGVVRVLDGVGLHVEDGGGLVVQGPAGSGTSALLRILGGLERPSGGSVVLNGTDLATVTECRLARIRVESIGMVHGGGPTGHAGLPGYAALWPGLTAQQNVASVLVSLRLRPDDCRELAAAALEEVGLGHRLGRLPGELDAGERRRVALARALVKRPAVLLADRPTAGLTAAARAQIIELFERLWGERRLSCVVATEDAALARRAPRLATLAAGRITSVVRQARPFGTPTAAPGP
ncbi:putative ABC transporter ATP-binding protein [Streptomyces sp. NBRC 110611]|uniref:ABC transporter ATP-binding protein n=1 Tax=Streptomyces sp. NBRC 110611 TaxID=1621259 RepID=UPI00082C8AC6|nr:ATP-binding cassette domain-containing protein [Streptomyces sp. NBRC 110611]GAU65691.1 putative ABC transporter ATP-binding protein [Streptomyces sp. NBRC 110611]